MRDLEDSSIDAIVTDPPYGLSFMGKKWDYDVPSVEVWAECLRVLKPGGHLLAFAGTRTQHRMAVRIEDAGLEIRDMIAWCYGSGFPKSLDVSKAIDKAAGAEREVVGKASGARNGNGQNNDYGAYGSASDGLYSVTAPATPEAQQWAGWGTALKPALEPITVARKPLTGTVAANVLERGTGALNVDGCRVATDELKGKVYNNNNNTGWKCTSAPSTVHGNETGRWPANLIHDGSDEVLALFPDVKGSKGSGLTQTKARSWKNTSTAGINRVGHDDTGSAARFFYCAKASKADRSEGNTHPTVKPTDLMRYLCRLVTPPGGIVLDPFMGSGSTGKAAVLEGFRFIGIERDPAYLEIARSRIVADAKQLPLLVA
jgi:site-specific DNA-methyltransferase (adenine-specific)